MSGTPFLIRDPGALGLSRSVLGGLRVLNVVYGVAIIAMLVASLVIPETFFVALKLKPGPGWSELTTGMRAIMLIGITGAFIGPLASGASAVAEKSMSAEIAGQHRKLLGVEMEAYGILAAAEEATTPRPEAIVLKGVSDYLDETKDDSMQRCAAYTSAAVLGAFVSEYL